MVAPAVGAALIGAAGSLLGGLFAPKPKWVTPNYQDIRNKAEAAGFNPLTALTSAPGQAMQGANYMGSAIADAGLMLADAFSQSKRGQNLSKVQAENDKLKERVQSLTLRPKVGGVYAARQAVPTVRQALGVSNALDGVQAAASAGVSQGASFGVSSSDPIKPDLTHTYKTFANDGQVTNVPLGPDVDEVLSGAFIAANNVRKAEDLRRSRMTFGAPLSMSDGIQMPPSYVPNYPKSKSDKIWDWVSGKNTSQGWPKFQLGY